MTSAADLVLSTRLHLYAARVKYSGNVVLQYNREADQLRIWKWPASDEARVHPRDLEDHRISHQMLGPCCLCPLAEATQPDFVEAAVYPASVGPYAGQYVASCAQGRCNYFVFMEKIYNKLGVPIQRYRIREPDERIPPQVVHVSENVLRGAGQSRPLKRTYAMLDINADVVTLNAPTKSSKRPTVSELLARLDARVRPGITDLAFRRLFVRCECGLITTRRAFREHDCIIEITSDSD